VAEAAVVGVADELTGQTVNAFVALKEGHTPSDALRKEFIMQVRRSIGPFAAPKAVHVVPDLPKTRSGKIMRRILRKILAGEEDQLGDITTVSYPNHGFDICHCQRMADADIKLSFSYPTRRLWK
jgi:acetyl-CoA synthetase